MFDMKPHDTTSNRANSNEPFRESRHLDRTDERPYQKRDNDGQKVADEGDLINPDVEDKTDE